MKSEDQLTQNWFIFSFFNSVGFIDFVLDLLPFLHIFFSQKNGTNQAKWDHSTITFALRQGDGTSHVNIQTGREGESFLCERSHINIFN